MIEFIRGTWNVVNSIFCVQIVTCSAATMTTKHHTLFLFDAEKWRDNFFLFKFFSISRNVKWFRLIKQRKARKFNLRLKKKNMHFIWNMHSLPIYRSQSVLVKSILVVTTVRGGTKWLLTMKMTTMMMTTMAATIKIFASSSTFAPQTADVNNNFKCISDNPIIIIEIGS